MHLKRQKVPKNWPTKRKGTTFVVKPNFGMGKGLPILVVLRNVLGIAQTRKEVKKALHERKVLVNNKLAKNEKNSVLLFDTITLVPSKRSYRLELSGSGKFKISEINSEEANKKVSKIINKKTLKGKKTQLNLGDGKNFISDIKCDVNDSVLIKDGKIEKCLPLKEKIKVFIFAGKHAGKEGIIQKIKLEKKIAELKIGDKDINVLIKQFMVVE